MRLPAAALAAAVLLPAAAAPAQDPAPSEPRLGPLKPCYVAVSRDLRERAVVQGSGFTPNGQVELAVDGEVRRTVPALADGSIAPVRLRAPFVRRGPRAFTVTATEVADRTRAVELRPLVVRLALRLQPEPSRFGQKVRWRGYGFTADRPVWAHYVRKGEQRRRQRLGRATGPCGKLSVRREVFPFEPAAGRWSVQVDQVRRFRRNPPSSWKVIPFFVPKRAAR